MSEGCDANRQRSLPISEKQHHNQPAVFVYIGRLACSKFQKNAVLTVSKLSRLLITDDDFKITLTVKINEYDTKCGPEMILILVVSS